jgi:hypothetical protein
MKYCLTSQAQKKTICMDLNPELWGEISTCSVFFNNDLRTYFTDQDYRSHKLITWSEQEITN